MEGSGKPAPALSGVVVVLLLEYLAQYRAWGWLRLAQGPGALKSTPGLLFAKVMGSGHHGGFSLRPSSSHQGLVCLFADQRTADQFTEGTQVLAMVSRAKYYWVGTLAVTSARGQWDQQNWETTPLHCLSSSSLSSADPQGDALVAALTRASIRPAKAISFWRYAPAAQADLENARGCQLAMGLGEAPLVRQCTFSLWEDVASMRQYAHAGAHGQAIAAASRHNYFAESLFVRMRVLNMRGNWQGKRYAPLGEVSHG